MSSSVARGTKSLIAGDRASVRLPRRTVPICVSDPIGFANPRRIAITPAIVVVLTAPRPTSRIPSFPSAFAIFGRFFTTDDYIIRISRDMSWFRKAAPTDPLAVTMTGVKLGDRLLVVGLEDVPLVAALASKAGLTGRAVILDADEQKLAKAMPLIEREGALVEKAQAPWGEWPFDDQSFDIIVFRDRLTTMAKEDRVRSLREAHRVLRP